MKLFISILILALSTIAPASYADDDDKLFINLTSDDAWRASMALTFANANLKKGYKVSVFLNVEGVRVATKALQQHSNGPNSKTLPEMVAEVMDNGGQVIICPMCLKRAGLTPADLIDGVIMGGPAVTFKAMYASDVQMSY